MEATYFYLMCFFSILACLFIVMYSAARSKIIEFKECNEALADEIKKSSVSVGASYNAYNEIRAEMHTRQALYDSLLAEYKELNTRHAALKRTYDIKAVKPEDLQPKKIAQRKRSTRKANENKKHS